MNNSCLFCGYSPIVTENEFAYSRYDKYPVSIGHMLIIPKRHISSYFDTSKEERNAMQEILDESRILLINEYEPNGFNIGVNDGVAAGQTIMHMHMHLIPRYEGDVSDPRGGIRLLLPDKAKYWE